MSTETETSRTEIFDSLPYYDDDLQKFPYLKEKVDQELARELKAPQTLHPRVPPSVELFADNPFLKAELERDWKAALDNAHAQLQHQRIRQQNLALLQTYGPNAFRIQNYLLEATVKQTEKTLEELKELIVEVNRERKNTQDRIGKQLTSLETRWTELISSVLQIEMANVALDAEIERLNKKEAELAEL
ncbi:breast carcinoma amplified sequence 2-domain-containing protein [Pholiota molesta]|nr:breast carcinoma amplified sequence 2-domain-containing protein [Pholiota molesta]